MIIEFIGTPGAGKTTLVPAVIEFLGKHGIEGFTMVKAARPYAQRTLLGQVVERLGPPSLRGPLLWQVYYRLSALHRLIFFAKRPRLLLYVLRTQRMRPDAVSVRKKRALFWFFHLAGGYDFLTSLARPNEALVFDDGFVHRTVHLNASAVEVPDRVKITSYLDLIPVPRVLIVLRAPVEVCVKRVQARGVWDYFRGKTRDELMQYLANADLTITTAVDYLKNKECRIIEVDNGQDNLPATLAELRGKLEDIPAFIK